MQETRTSGTSLPIQAQRECGTENARESPLRPGAARRVGLPVRATRRRPWPLFTIRDVANQPLLESVTINGVPVVMEMDTGAAFSVTQTTYQKIAQQSSIKDLEPSDLKLRSYTGETIQWRLILATRNVSCTYK